MALRFPSASVVRPSGMLGLNLTHPLSRGLVGFWPLGDGVGVQRDITPYGNFASTSGAVALASAKFGGQSLWLPGTGNSISAPSGAQYNSTSGSVAGLFQFTAIHNYQQILCSRSDTNSRNGISLFIDAASSKVGFQIYDSGSTVINLLGTSTVGLNTWYHIAATFGGSGLPSTIYLDGVEQATANASGPWSFNGQPVLWGGSQDVFWAKQYGPVQAVRWYNRQLNASEISAISRNPWIGTYASSFVQVGLVSAPPPANTNVPQFMSMGVG